MSDCIDIIDIEVTEKNLKKDKRFASKLVTNSMLNEFFTYKDANANIHSGIDEAKLESNLDDIMKLLSSYGIDMYNYKTKLQALTDTDYMTYTYNKLFSKDIDTKIDKNELFRYLSLAIHTIFDNEQSTKDLANKLGIKIKDISTEDGVIHIDTVGLSSTIGKKILDSYNLQFDTYDAELRDKQYIKIGNEVLRVLEQIGLITTHTSNTPKAINNMYLNRNLKTAKYFKPKMRYKNFKLYQSKTITINHTNNTHKLYEVSRSMNYLLLSNLVRQPSNKSLDEVVDKNKRSKTSNEVMKKVQDSANSINPIMKGFFKYIKEHQDKSKEPLHKVFKDLETNEELKEVMFGTLSKKRKIVELFNKSEFGKSLSKTQHLYKFIESFKVFTKPFYNSYFRSSNGRDHIYETEGDFQGDKYFSRPSFESAEVQKFKRGSIEHSYAMAKLMDVTNLSLEQLYSDKVQKYVNMYNNINLKDAKQCYNFYKTISIDFKDNELPFKSKSPAEAISLIKAISELTSKKRVIKTNLLFSSDASASGVALYNLQVINNPEIQQMFKRLGMKDKNEQYIDDGNSISSFYDPLIEILDNEYKEKLEILNDKDIKVKSSMLYTELAKVKTYEYINKLVDLDVYSKKDFAKMPTMRNIYNQTEFNNADIIGNNIAIDAIDNFLIGDTKLYDTLVEMSEDKDLVKGLDLPELNADLRSLTKEDLTNENKVEQVKEIKEYLRRLSATTIGDLLVTTLTENFTKEGTPLGNFRKQMEEVYNALTKLRNSSETNYDEIKVLDALAMRDLKDKSYAELRRDIGITMEKSFNTIDESSIEDGTYTLLKKNYANVNSLFAVMAHMNDNAVQTLALKKAFDNLKTKAANGIMLIHDDITTDIHTSMELEYTYPEAMIELAKEYDYVDALLKELDYAISRSNNYSKLEELKKFRDKIKKETFLRMTHKKLYLENKEWFNAFGLKDNQLLDTKQEEILTKTEKKITKRSPLYYIKPLLNDLGINEKDETLLEWYNKLPTITKENLKLFKSFTDKINLKLIEDGDTAYDFKTKTIQINTNDVKINPNTKVNNKTNQLKFNTLVELLSHEFNHYGTFENLIDLIATKNNENPIKEEAEYILSIMDKLKSKIKNFKGDKSIQKRLYYMFNQRLNPEDTDLTEERILQVLKNQDLRKLANWFIYGSKGGSTKFNAVERIEYFFKKYKDRYDPLFLSRARHLLAVAKKKQHKGLDDINNMYRIAEFVSIYTSEPDVRNAIHKLLDHKQTITLFQRVKKLLSKIYNNIKDKLSIRFNEISKDLDEKTKLELAVQLFGDKSRKNETIINKYKIQEDNIVNPKFFHKIGDEYNKYKGEPKEFILNKLDEEMSQYIVKPLIDYADTFSSSLFEKLDKLLEDKFESYNDIKEYINDEILNSRIVKQTKTYLGYNKAINKDLNFNKVLSSALNVEQQLQETENKGVFELDQKINEYDSSPEFKAKLDDIFSRSTIQFLDDSEGYLKDLINETKSLNDIEKELEDKLNNKQHIIRNTEELAHLYIHGLVLNNQLVNGDSLTFSSKEYQKAFNQLVAIKSLKLLAKDNSQLGYKGFDPIQLLKELPQDLIKELLVTSKMVTNATMEAYENGDVKAYRGNFVKDVYKENLEVNVVTYSDMLNNKYPEKLGWRILRKPTSNSLGVVYRENDVSSFMQGAMTNINYIDFGLRIPTNHKVSIVDNVVTSPDGHQRLVLTKNEQNKLGIIRNPAYTLIRSAAHLVAVKDSQHIRDFIIEKMTGEAVTDDGIEEVIHQINTDKQHPWFLELEADQLYEDLPKEIRNEYEVATNLSEIKGFNKRARLVRKDISFALTGYKQVKLFQNSITLTKLSNVYLKLLTMLKIKWVALSPTKIVKDFAGNIGLNLTLGVPVNDIYKYSKEAIKGIERITQYRERLLDAKVKRLAYKDDRLKKLRYEKLIKFYEDRLSNDEMSPALFNGFFQSISTNIILKENTTVQGLQSSINKVLEKLALTKDKEDVNYIGKLVKKFYSLGYDGEKILLAMSNKLGDNFHSNMIKQAYEKIQHIKKNEDVVAYINEWIGGPSSSMVDIGSTYMQVADITQRWVLYKHLKDKGLTEEEAVKETLENFIDYKINMPKHMKFLSDYGILLFPSFWSRMFKIFNKVAKSNPFSFGTSMMLEYTLGHTGANVLMSSPQMKLIEGIPFTHNPSEFNPFEAIFGQFMP